MKSSIHKEIEITLKLTQEEAEWLIEWTKTGLHYETESEEDSRMRTKFFHAINDLL